MCIYYQGIYIRYQIHIYYNEPRRNIIFNSFAFIYCVECISDFSGEALRKIHQKPLRGLKRLSRSLNYALTYFISVVNPLLSVLKYK